MDEPLLAPEFLQALRSLGLDPKVAGSALES